MVWRGLPLIALCLALASAAAAGPWATISVPVGGVFSLELPARPARAMGWRLAGELPEGRLELESVRYRQGEADTATDPGAGVEVWTFQALWPGAYAIVLEYRRAWGKAVKPAEVHRYQVRVTGRPPLGEEAEE